MPLVILLFALFASLFSLSKGALSFAEPFFLIGSRMTFAGILLISYQLVVDNKNYKLKIKHIIYLTLLGFLNIYITNIAEIWGIKHMTSSKVCLMYSLSPFLSALAAYIILKETLNLKKWLGMLIGFIGLIPILSVRNDIETLLGELWVFSYAELSVLIAVLSSVCGWILLKKIINDCKYSPIMANGISMFIGGILSLCHSYIAGENWDPVPVIQWVPFLEISFSMCIISNIICYNLYGYLLKRYTATFMSFAGLITPLFASLFGWLFLQETISYHFFVSMALFTTGLTIFYQEELRKEDFKNA